MNKYKKENACNAAYSQTLKEITDSVKPYMDKRIKGDAAWKYPMLVITILRKVCDSAVMSAGRYDGKRPPHRVYDITCTKDGYRFAGNLIVTGLLHRDDADDVSAFDEYDMTLSLMNIGKASTNAIVANAMAARNQAVTNATDTEDLNKSVTRDIDQLEKRIDEGIKKNIESFCYWMDSDYMRQVKWLEKIDITDDKLKGRVKAMKNHINKVCEQAKRIK